MSKVTFRRSLIFKLFIFALFIKYTNIHYQNVFIFKTNHMFILEPKPKINYQYLFSGKQVIPFKKLVKLMTAAAISNIIYMLRMFKFFLWIYEFHFGKLDVLFLVCGSIYDHIMNLQYKRFLDSTCHVYIDETADYETIW